MYVPTRGRGSIQSWLSGLESVARCAYEPCSAARSIRACILHACTSGSPDLSQKPVVPAPEKSRSISVEIFAGTQGRRVDVWKKNILLKIRFRSISTPPFFFAKPRSVYASPKCQVFFCAPLRSRDKPWGWNIAGVVATGGESPHESSKSIPKAPTDPSFLLSLLRPQTLVIRLESILYRGKK